MKRTALNRHGKSERSRYIRLLDYMWGTFILLRDKSCIVCGICALDPHHVFSRQSCPNVRYDPVNGVGLCKGHHKWGVHQNPELYRPRIINFIENTHGKGAYERLTARAYLKGNLKMGDLLLVELDLRNLLQIKENPDNLWFNKSYTAKMEHLKEMRRR